MFLMFLIFTGEIKLSNVPFLSGGAAVDELGYVAVISRGTALVFDQGLSHVKSYTGKGRSRVFRYKNGLLIVDFQEKKAVLYRGGVEVAEYRNLNPRVFAEDGGREFIFPKQAEEVEDSEATQKLFEDYDRLILQEIQLDRQHKKVGPQFFKITSNQARSQMNYKGFFPFTFGENLHILTQTDASVFVLKGDGSSVGSQDLELPGFIDDVNPEPLDPNRIYTKSELQTAYQAVSFSNSRIMNAFRFGSGFVVCYWGPGLPPPPFMQLAFFDSEWNRVGDIRQVPGWLIGIHDGQGIVVTFPDENGNSEVERVGLGR